MDLPIANTRKLKDKKLGAMWEKTQRALHEFYRPHNERLAQLLQEERFLWDDVSVATQPDAVTATSQEEGGGGNLTLDGEARFKQEGSHAAGSDRTLVDEEGSESVNDGVPYDVNSDVGNDVKGDDDGEGGIDGGDVDMVTDAGVEGVSDFAQNGQGDEVEEEEEEEEAEDYEDSGYSYSDSGYEEEYEEDEENNDEDS